MSVIASALKHMLAAGMPADAIVAAVAEMEASLAHDPVAEKRRAYDRERKRVSRSNVSTGHPPDSTDIADKADTPLSSPSPSFPPDPQTNPTPAYPRDNTPRARKADQFVCPNGVDPVDWEALIANRKSKRAALSDGAHRQILKKLEGWERDGWPPGPIVACAAERGWTTVFETDEMKGRQNGNDRQGSANRNRGRDGFLNACHEAADAQARHPFAGNG